MTLIETLPALQWDVDDLVRRLCGALDTAALAVRTISDVNGVDGRPHAAALRTLADKVVAETAMLLLATSSVEGSHLAIGERVAALVAQIEPLARSDEVIAAICLDAGSAREHAFSHAVLSRLGSQNRAIDELLAMSLALGTDFGPERLPFRQLEQRWLQRVWNPGGLPTRPDADLAAGSMLGRPLDALAATREDVYAFTHAVMYVSDLGARRPPLPRPIAEIVGDAEAALAFSLDGDDFDLTAELLLTWPMLRAAWSPAATFAFGVLADVEDELGFVPGSSFDVARYEDLDGVARADYRLLTTYHTVYVMGILYAAALAQKCAPPPQVTVSPGMGDAASALGAPRSVDERGPRWRQAFADLEAGQRDCLADLLIASALRRAAASGDAAQLRSVLQAAVDCDRIDGPSVRQAAALLRRMALLSALHTGQ